MFQGRSNFGMVLGAIIFVVVATFVSSLIDKYITVPVVHEIAQAFATIMSSATKSPPAA